MYPIPPNATRIRYLESTGTQYIDTMVSVANTLGYVARAEFDSSNTWLCGARSGYNQNQFGLLYDSNGKFVCRYGNTEYTTSGDEDAHTFSHIGNVFSIDGVVKKTFTQQTFSASAPFYLFSTSLDNSGTPATAGFVGRIYSCDIYSGSTLVRDFVPVRVGTVGYLFDRVSGQLFGNAGTGDFVLGPDTFAQGVVPTRMMAMGVMKREPNTRDYVQQGLVGMWDGVENAGRGAHDSQARMIDLAGNHVPLAFSNASTDSDAIVLTASSYATLNANEWADIRTIFNSGNFTIQFCGEPSTGSNNWWTIMNSTPDSNYGRITVRPTFTTSSNLYKKFQAAVFGDSGATWGGTGPGMGLNANYNMPALFDGTPGSFRCASVICNSNGSASVVVNDTRFDFTTGSWPISTTRTGDMYFGHENSSAGNAAGKWHSIRIYNRALSASEVAANYAIDKARFNLP